MENLDLIDLPPWPSKGDRRRLEGLWLERLELHGLRRALPQPPLEVPTELSQAVDEFNARLFWQCHETLEDIWRQTPYPLRFFYHAIIKAAVGFYHKSRHNRHGAKVKLADAVRLLRLFQPNYLGLRTDLMLGETSIWLAKVGSARRLNWTELDAMPTPIIRMVE